MAFMYNAVKRLKDASQTQAQIGALSSVSLARKSLFANRPTATIQAEFQYIIGSIRQKQPYLLWAAEHGQYIEDQVDEEMKGWLSDHPGTSKQDAARVRVVIQNQRRAAEYRDLPEAVRQQYAMRFKEGKSPKPEAPEEK